MMESASRLSLLVVAILALATAATAQLSSTFYDTSRAPRLWPHNQEHGDGRGKQRGAHGGVPAQAALPRLLRRCKSRDSRSRMDL